VGYQPESDRLWGFKLHPFLEKIKKQGKQKKKKKKPAGRPRPQASDGPGSNATNLGKTETVTGMLSRCKINDLALKRKQMLNGLWMFELP
jgi:hypothetical protein